MRENGDVAPPPPADHPEAARGPDSTASTEPVVKVGATVLLVTAEYVTVAVELTGTVAVEPDEA